MVKVREKIVADGLNDASFDVCDTGVHLDAERFNELTSKDDTILIDCRNHKEYEIGHFEGALDPNTKTFEQFPRWVSQNKAGLQGKNVLMCKCGCGNCYEGIMRCTKEIEQT